MKIDNIVENYISHYIYLSPSYYEKVFDKKVKYNAQLLNLSSTKNENEICEKLLDNDNVVNVTLSSKIKFLCGSADLGFVILIIIASSGSLAFVVLYNLANINIGERQREIATLKVLGFYDKEVDNYINNKKKFKYMEVNNDTRFR